MPEDYTKRQTLVALSINRVFLLLGLVQNWRSESINAVSPILLWLSKSAEQSDIKDKVYGILGLLGSTIVAKIILDYEQDISDVFINFTKAVILSKNSLDSLRRAGVPAARIFASPDDYFLLSWVEDLACDSLDRNTLGMTYPGMYFAGGDTPSKIRFLDQDKILSCHGIILDSVDGMNIPFAISERDPGFRPVVKPSSSKNAYSSETAVLDAVWRTLVGNRTEAENSGSIPQDNWKDAVRLLRGT